MPDSFDCLIKDIMQANRFSGESVHEWALHDEINDSYFAF